MEKYICKNMEFKETGVVKMIEKQSAQPYYECRGVDELLRAYPQSVTRIMAHNLFLLGYMDARNMQKNNAKEIEERKAELNKGGYM